MFTTVVKVPGSCGELAQGVIAGQDFLISCPIDIYSKVSLKLSKDINGIIIDDSFEKSRKAIEKTLKYYNKIDLGGIFEIESDLLQGRGMGSSTADMVACIAGIMDNLNCEIDLQVIKNIILSIEPSDGIFLPGINLFDHKNGSREIYLGEPPNIAILIFSMPGLVDTLAFNQNKVLDRLKREKELEIKNSLKYIKEGIKTGNKKMIGKGATISSFAHQNILHKPYLLEIKNLVDGYKVVFGVNIAHSGTLIGILVEPDFDDVRLIDEIKLIDSDLEYITKANLISGGIEII